mmetsp:Transcript_27714/g.50350  ORF Transcript_27714/g.50350 Transcript_27714/m.50350 type:complete len:955 (-) Transcript_27714:34-2898(-)
MTATSTYSGGGTATGSPHTSGASTPDAMFSPPQTLPPTLDQHEQAFPTDSTTTTTPLPKTAVESPSTSLPSLKNKPKNYYYDEDDDDDESRLFFWHRIKMPRMPHLRGPSKLLSKLFGGFGDSDDQAYLSMGSVGDLTEDWSNDDDKRGKRKIQRRPRNSVGGRASSSTTPSGRRESNGVPSPVMTLLQRGTSSSSMTVPLRQNGNLLSTNDAKRCHRMGQGRAILDAASVGLLLFAIQEAFLHWNHVDTWTLGLLPRSFPEVPTFLSHLLGGALVSFQQDTWVYYALAAAVLMIYTNDLWFQPRLRSLARSVGNIVQSDASYSQLYLRLVSAMPPNSKIPRVLRETAQNQVWSSVESARLSSFVTIVLITLAIVTVAVVQPIALAIFSASKDVVMLESWRHWPIEWGPLKDGLQETLIPLGHALKSLILEEWESVVRNPLALVVKSALFLSLLVASFLPKLEQISIAKTSVLSDAAKDEEDDDWVGLRTETVADMGISSASRLSLLSQNGAIEGTLQRWSVMHPRGPGEGLSSLISRQRSLGTAVKHLAYLILASILLASPLILHILIPTDASLTDVGPYGQNFVNMACVLFYTFWLVQGSLSHIGDNSIFQPMVMSFLQSLSRCVQEVTAAQKSRQPDLQLTASRSPTKGLVVSDLWAAHATKRAWAVRGADLECRNGEVLLVLGDHGSGKTRLLTAISENILNPPARARSTTPARGSVQVGGMDTSKWDPLQLRNSIGLVLQDVRTLADTAGIASGCTLEEILEPIGMLSHTQFGSQNMEKRAMEIALQVTGLSTTLLPRFPSKLSTVVSANEEELSATEVRPPSNALSTCEWSKVLLAKVLAQTIMCNVTPDTQHGTDPSKNCLVGSILLLDNVMAMWNELEEARLIQSLRASGAATILTSNRWALGRLADRIAVVVDGSVVERGTHSELLSMGPHRSIYAAKWKQILSS